MTDIGIQGFNNFNNTIDPYDADMDGDQFYDLNMNWNGNDTDMNEPLTWGDTEHGDENHYWND